MPRLRKMIFIALLVAQAVILGLVELAIPLPFLIPGAKLGLGNLITVISLVTLSKKESFLLIWLRLFLLTLLGGTVATFLFSLSGALLSYFSMLGLVTFCQKKVSLLGISAAGGFMHNVGQILVAAVIARTWSVFLYLPFLALLGILTGSCLGIAAHFLLQRVPILKNYNLLFAEKKDH